MHDGQTQPHALLSAAAGSAPETVEGTVALFVGHARSGVDDVQSNAVALVVDPHHEGRTGGRHLEGVVQVTVDDLVNAATDGRRLSAADGTWS